MPKKEGVNIAKQFDLEPGDSEIWHLLFNLLAVLTLGKPVGLALFQFFTRLLQILKENKGMDVLDEVCGVCANLRVLIL